MGSAFEQLLDGAASQYKLGRNFGALFQPYGKVTVVEAQKARENIKVDTSKPQYEAAQLFRWFVHQKWIKELYAVRNKSVHEGSADNRTWGWFPWEHLLMAAWVFPLAVKLLLRREGYSGPDVAD